MNGASTRGADRVAATLAGAGIKRLFTLSGNHIMSIFDASLDAGIELIHVRHEAAAVHMADAWSRLTGQVGVALLTGGPGHANGVSALYTARLSESAMLLRQELAAALRQILDDGSTAALTDDNRET